MTHTVDIEVDGETYRVDRCQPTLWIGERDGYRVRLRWEGTYPVRYVDYEREETPQRGARWRDDEPVDGAGLPLRAHADALAARLALNDDQREVLVAELRNALVPTLLDAEDHGAERAAKQVERALALTDAIARRRV
jgi:hypothetical protein